jgi:hypothetical protein
MKFFCLFSFLLFTTYSYCQQQSSPFVQSTSFDSVVKQLPVDTLNGKIKAIHSRNYGLRAGTLQQLVESCAKYYEKKFTHTKFTVQLMVLNQKDWEALDIFIPYGLPTNLNAENTILIATDKKYVGELFGKSDTLPDDVLSEFDYVCLHELGHHFFEVMHKINTGKSWANEFLASYFAICYIHATKSKTGLPDFSMSEYQPQYKTLEDFEKLYIGVGPPNYAWYQQKFIELGEKLYSKFRLKLIQQFLQNYSSKEKNIDPQELLNQLAPEIMEKWLNEMK